MLLEQHLRAAEREHARQRPSGDRHHAVGRAGRQDERVERDRLGIARAHGMKLLVVSAPGERLRPVVDAVAQAIERRMEVPIVRSLGAKQRVDVERAGRRAAPIDLPARLASLVDHVTAQRHAQRARSAAAIPAGPAPTIATRNHERKSRR